MDKHYVKINLIHLFFTIFFLNNFLHSDVPTTQVYSIIKLVNDFNSTNVQLGKTFIAISAALAKTANDQKSAVGTYKKKKK